MAPALASPATSFAAAAIPASPYPAVLDIIGDVAIRELKKKLGPFGALLDAVQPPLSSPEGKSVPGSSWPEWYSNAVAKGQPNLSTTERERKAAERLAEAQRNLEKMQYAVKNIPFFNSNSG